MIDRSIFDVQGRVWLWRPAEPTAGGWHFLTVDGQTAAEIRFATLGRAGGFGSIKVEASLGGSRWRTSLFPHRASGGFLLPLKAEVRRRENVGAGDEVTVRLAV